MRWLGALVFALAALATAFSSSGLAVAPHAHPPGTPAFHDHVLAAYRYPLFLLRLERSATTARGPRWTLETSLAVGLAALALALLTFRVPRLPRPTRRPLAAIAPVRLAAPQWRHPLDHGPPRAATLLSLPAT